MNIMTKRKKRHSPEKILRQIQQADRILAEGGDVAAALKELKQLEKQNLQLKKLLAEAELEKAVLKELAGRAIPVCFPPAPQSRHC